jgi:hypothetical protein
MQTNWLRSVALAAVWGFAVATWASIAHHMIGIPDVGPVAVVVSTAAILGWPLREQLRSRREDT